MLRLGRARSVAAGSVAPVRAGSCRPSCAATATMGSTVALAASSSPVFVPSASLALRAARTAPALRCPQRLFATSKPDYSNYKKTTGTHREMPYDLLDRCLLRSGGNPRAATRRGSRDASEGVYARARGSSTL
jgi:hypothetical protein